MRYASETVSIPRLELTAATVAVKLDIMLQNELSISLNESTFWTDSTAVIKYIRNEDKRFQTFVANKIALTREKTSVDQWNHIEDSLNPADFTSRGLSASDTEKIRYWLRGPEFLWQSKSSWQEPINLSQLSSEDPEIKQACVCVTKVEKTSPLKTLIDSHSSWFKLLTSVAWILRLRKTLGRRCIDGGRKMREPGLLPEGELSVQELNEAELELMVYIQREVFPDESESLKALQRLNPTEIDGILRQRTSWKCADRVWNMASQYTA